MTTQEYFDTIERDNARLQEDNGSLKKRLNEILNIGVYPQSVKCHSDSSKGYEKRTEWMEGWNAAVTKIHEINEKEIEK